MREKGEEEKRGGERAGGIHRAGYRFRPGDRIRVRSMHPKGHVRTPYYIRGKVGRVEKVYGHFLNPESLGHGGDGLPRVALYLVGFSQKEVWEDYRASSSDSLFVDIFEHWLERA